MEPRSRTQPQQRRWRGPQNGGGGGGGSSRPWVRKWTLYAPPTSADGGVPAMPATFRVVSFNVLADYIVARDLAEKAADAWKLEWTYRRQRLVNEILSWMPQIICLQEVDHFDDFFEPELRKAGFSGVYKKRTGDETQDGCAIFVLSSCFSIVSTHPLEFFTPGHAVLDRHNIALQAIVEWRPHGSDLHHLPPKRFVVANTHLLFNPGRGDVKLAQLQLLFESLASLRTLSSSSDSVLPLVLCGDFNLAPHSGLYEYISQGVLNVSGLSKHMLSGQNMDDHQKQLIFQNEQDFHRHYGHGTTMGKFSTTRARRSWFHHFPQGTTVSHSFEFASAYAQSPNARCTGEPKFTTFHDGTKGTVDYIWYTKDMQCHGVVEMVPAGLLFQSRGMPTAHHASDHLALIAEFSIE